MVLNITFINYWYLLFFSLYFCSFILLFSELKSIFIVVLILALKIQFRKTVTDKLQG